MKKLTQNYQYLIGCAILFVSLVFSIYLAQASSHLAAPKMISPKSGESVVSPIQFVWEPVAGAATYSYEFGNYYSQQWQDGPITSSSKTQETLELSASEKSGDTMRWRVWATDAQGKDGEKSPWNEFTLQYTAPAGAVVDEIKINPTASEGATNLSELSKEELIGEYQRIIANEKTWQRELQKLQLEKFGKKLPKKWKKLKRKFVHRGIEAEYYGMLDRFEKAKNYFKEKDYEEATRFAKSAEKQYLVWVPSKLAQLEEEEAMERNRKESERAQQETEAENRRISEIYQRQLDEGRAGRQKHLKAQCGTDLNCLIAAAELCVPRKISLKWLTVGEKTNQNGITSTLEVKEKTGDFCRIYFRNDKVNLAETYADTVKGGGYKDYLESLKGLDGSCTFDQRVMWETGEPEGTHVLMDLKKESEKNTFFNLMDFLHSTKINYSCEGNIFQTY